MARDDHLEKKGRWSLKSLFKPGLRHRSFRHARVQHRQHDVLPPLPEHGPSSPQPLPAGHEAPPTPPAAPPAAEQQAGNGLDASPARSCGGAAPHLPAGCSLIVQVLGARRLRAADSNGLSDPYCVVKVGEHKASSKTELKTLEPRWNETMCFGAEDVADAVEGGRPHVCLRVFDWDLVSADDFLGQCELPFDSLATRGGAAPPRWLPLYGFARSGKQVDAGEVHVAAWFQAGGGPGEAGGDAPSTLCSPPGVRKQVPQVVHSSRGVLYEEPLVACLAITLDSLEGVPLRGGGGGAPPGAGRPREASTDSLGSLGSPQASWQGSGPGRAAAPRFLGRLFQRRPRHGDSGAAASASSMYSAGSTASEAMLAGEDSGDEYDGLDFYSKGLAELQAGPDDGPGGEEEAAAAAALHPGSGAHTPVRARASSDAGIDPLARPSAFGAAGEGGEGDGSPTPGASSGGSRLYVRLVLGRQKQTSWIKRQREGSALAWHQTLVFATPLPLRDRQLRLELYRTASSTQRGRLVALAQVWLHDLVPPGLARDPKASRAARVELQSALRGQPGGCAHLRCTLVDTDGRRAMYGGVFVEGEGEEEEEAAPRMGRLESWTAELSGRELRKKALLSEQSFSAWEESRPHRAKQRAMGYRDAAVELAQLGWQRLSAYLSSSSDHEAHLPAGAPAHEDGPAAAAPPPPPRVPQPAGTLQLTVHSISLPGPCAADCFLVLKCGPHWGRSKALPMAGGSSVECGWQLSLPVLDPAAVLTLALFQHSRGMRATERLRHGLLHSSGTTTAVGKLRVRLSCLRPNTPLTADLALLGERSKGGHEAAAVRLSLQACYPSARALLKGYAAPPLPPAAYEHGLSGREHQGVMARECRRIVLRWLESANPAIGGPEALMVLDAEREVFAMSRARVNVRRIKMALVGLRRVHRKFDAIKTWQDPRQSVAAMAAICFLCFNPSRALPLLLGWVVVATLSAQPDYESSVPRMEQDPPDIQPENESLEAASANPLAALRARLERLQRMGLLVQGALDEVACAMERAEALLTWQDPCTTLGVVCVLAAVALLVLALGLPAVLAFALCFVIRPPALRTPTPPLPAVVFGKLPTRRDRIV